MGRSNSTLKPIYNRLIPRRGPTALLGATENYLDLNSVDLYDLRLNQWDINSDWKLNKKYNSIISTRCPYFAKNPEEFVRKCYENLNHDGQIFLDWGLGDHWRFENYKVGWVKAGEHESFYEEGNYLWSAVWDDSFIEHPQYTLFQNRVRKFGYEDVKKAVFEEVPSVLQLKTIQRYFDLEYDLLALWDDSPQLYIFVRGTKK